MGILVKRKNIDFDSFEESSPHNGIVDVAFSKSATMVACVMVDVRKKHLRIYETYMPDMWKSTLYLSNDILSLSVDEGSYKDFRNSTFDEVMKLSKTEEGFFILNLKFGTEIEHFSQVLRIISKRLEYYEKKFVD